MLRWLRPHFNSPIVETWEEIALPATIHEDSSPLVKADKRAASRPPSFLCSSVHTFRSLAILLALSPEEEPNGKDG
jgi:hypothetical protein